jgi:hypothetical protein
MSQTTTSVARPPVLERSRYLVLLVCLVGMVGLLPMLPPSPPGHRAIGLDLALFSVLIACIWSMGHRKRVIAIGCLLLVPGFAAVWFTSPASGPLLPAVALVCALAFLTFTALVMLLNILRQRDVATDTILGGICVYLLFAVMWALVYEIIERLHPGSFGPWSTPTGKLATGRLVSPDLIYYSVFTLSTIGPQDVHPISGAARSWTGLEAMLGQLYLAVLIARLVGRHASKSSE